MALTQGSQQSAGSRLAPAGTNIDTRPGVSHAARGALQCTTIGPPGIDFAVSLQPLGDTEGGVLEPAANSRITCCASVAVNPSDSAGRHLNAVMAVSMFAGLLNTCGTGPGIDVRAVLTANEGLTGLAPSPENVEWVESVLAGTAVRSPPFQLLRVRLYWSLRVALGLWPCSTYGYFAGANYNGDCAGY